MSLLNNDELNQVSGGVAAAAMNAAVQTAIESLNTIKADRFAVYDTEGINQIIGMISGITSSNAATVIANAKKAAYKFSVMSISDSVVNVLDTLKTALGV